MIASSFVSDRLLLKPFNDADVELMQKLDSDEQVVRFLGNGKIKTYEESKKNLSKILTDYQIYGLGLFAAYRKDNHDFIGRSGLIPWILDDTLVWEIGYSFIRDVWGKGFATEAARMLVGRARDNLHVTHVVSIIHPHNAASIHIAQKIGMNYSRTLKIGDQMLSVYRLDFC